CERAVSFMLLLAAFSMNALSERSSLLEPVLVVRVELSSRLVRLVDARSVVAREASEPREVVESLWPRAGTAPSPAASTRARQQRPAGTEERKRFMAGSR